VTEMGELWSFGNLSLFAGFLLDVDRCTPFGNISILCIFLKKDASACA
jgi:hypothetical protein